MRPDEYRVERFRSAHGLLIGLSRLRREGVTPRAFLFMAVDGQDTVQLAIARDERAVELKVGEKMTLDWPFGDGCYFDSVHRLPGDVVLYDGDRRLAHSGEARDAAEAVAMWLKHLAARNVFFGCTPHQPGAWLTLEGRQVSLHDQGFLEVVPTPGGLLARKIDEPDLYFVGYPQVGEIAAWQPVFTSSLGNVLMLERRVLGGRLVLSCARGLCEVDLARLPRVAETARAELPGGFAVVGRVTGGGFAVTRGSVQPWGLSGIAPARLIGSAGATLADVADMLRAEAAAS